MMSLVAASARRARDIGLFDQLGRKAKDGPRTASQRQREGRYATLLAQTGNEAIARRLLERQIGGNDLVGISYLRRGLLAARPVCRVHLRDGDGRSAGFGTGFLVAPGVLMTNHHVIGSAAQAAAATAEFDYELDADGQPVEPVVFRVLTSPAPIALAELDFCLVAIAPTAANGRRLSTYGWLPLDPSPGKAFLGEYLTIVQHPGGERKQICVRENELLRADEGSHTVWYRTDTSAGSSGSPVFNGSWQVVALHHSGVPKMEGNTYLTHDDQPWDASMGDDKIQWIANEGIRISSICTYLRDHHQVHPLAAAVLRRPTPPREIAAGAASGPVTSQTNDGELQVTIPVRIAVRVGGLLGEAAPAPAAEDDHGTGSDTAPPSVAPAPDGGLEAVVIDQSNYQQRKGYSPTFLGDGRLRVPLPVLTARLRSQIARAKGAADGELRYWNYSVVMNKARRLAFYAAVNVDPKQRPTGAGRDGDRWYLDSRIAKEAQLGQDFYGGQKEFELDRSKNPFDRGHLVRRLDAQWGRNAQEASRNGNDSFHFTNCAPQHFRFNQGSKSWLGLEDYVIQGFAGGGRACVINGPVFDAPWSRLDRKGRLVPQLRARGAADPHVVLDGMKIAIPKLFFKIVAVVDDRDRLAVAAFLMSQEGLLRTVGSTVHGVPPAEQEALTEAEARLYQVRIEDIEHLTGLRMTELRGHDVVGGDPSEAAREIRSLPEIELRPQQVGGQG